MNTGAERVSAPLAAWRGVRLRCPKCGARTLFRAYLALGLRAPDDARWLMPAVLAGIVVFALILLPRVKGVLAALLWRAGREM